MDGMDARRIVPGPARDADPLWREHGWGLGGQAVALLVAAVLALAVVVQVLG